MAPRSRSAAGPKLAPDPDGMFSGIVVFLIPNGVQSRRLQIWKQKLLQMGAIIEKTLSQKVTHVLALNSSSLCQMAHGSLKECRGRILSYEWLEDCLKSGTRVSEDPYVVQISSQEGASQSRKIHQSPEITLSDDEQLYHKKARTEKENLEAADQVGGAHSSNRHDIEDDLKNGHGISQASERESDSSELGGSDVADPDIETPDKSNEGCSDEQHHASTSKPSSVYSPPDLNKHITEIFGKLINIYRALGDDRRSFSYYKAIPVIEKLPFKIENAEQVKNLPAIGKSLKDHIQEIVTTGKLSKLEHFENDEKVRAVSLFGEVWGIGPATALKLYEKGHRTLGDLKNEESLTHSQRIGLQYFDDIKKRIPRQEVKDMEMLLQRAGEQILPGVIVVCGGSYRRGKASCGDMDIVITHPDGQSHKGFLAKFVQYLKDINFLREDLVFSTHSTEGTDSGVDTYFGLCTYPGRELRHRIDFKVYPRSIYAFGLIAWTGNDVLNRQLRLLAESKGYRLDDTGLFLATQSSSGKRGVKSSTSVKCNTEREVFDFLGFPWLEPHERNL